MGYWDAWTCSDCVWLDPNDKKYGEMYCTNRRWYVKPDSSSCDRFKANRIEVLNGLSLFKDIITVFNPEAYAFMRPYEGIEEHLSNCLSNDKEQDSILASMINTFAKPAIESIKNNRFEEAIRTYKLMLDKLIQKYELNLECLNSVPQRGL